jgi:hypothetical protein
MKKLLTSLLGVLALVTACREVVPTRPEELREGTFAVRFRGVMVVPRRFSVDESIRGSACRKGDYIRLDNQSMTRRFVLRFPKIDGRPQRYVSAYPEESGRANAHLNLGGDIKSVSSLFFVNGSATVTASTPDDALGTLEGQLAQEFLDRGLVPDSLKVDGVFHATRCPDWLFPQQ